MGASQETSIITCDAPPADHLDGHGYLFGYPIAHSLSPLLHKTIFDALGLNWDYFLLPSTDMAHFLHLARSAKCYGSAVTMPNKVAIIPQLDELGPECQAVGACNTIYRRGGKLIGTNTDIVGIAESFLHNTPEVSLTGRPGMVIGGGGAARSAVYALVKSMQCTTVYLVNRDQSEVEAVVAWCTSQGYGDGLIHVATAAQADDLEGPGAIVACVPDFPPVTEAEKEARRVTEVFLRKPRKGAMLEMCYHPSPWTELGALGEKFGWQVILGTEAMIYQGFQQAKLWTGRSFDELPVQRVKDAIAEALRKTHL